MTWTGCEETAWWLTWALRQGDVCDRVNAAVLAQASAPELIEAIIVGLEPAIQERVRMEMGELPAASIHGILAAWRMAADGGMPFVFESVRPERPLELARRRSVRLTVDVDDEGVHAGLSHIPARVTPQPETPHAVWYDVSMTARVSAADQDYMRRLGEFMAEVKAEQLREHLSLTVNERLVRSERLAKRNGGGDAARAQQDDHAAFFRRARELGLCDA